MSVNQNDRPWVAIQRNPTSGTGLNRIEILKLVQHLRNHGLSPRVYKRREQLDRAVANPKMRQTLRCIVAAGGDGTVCDVANRFPDTPIAIMPMGTENLFSKYLGIPKSGEFVADMVARNHTKKFDMGRLNDQRFILMASFGFDAEVVRRTDERRRGHISKLNYLQPIAATLRNYRYPDITLRYDDEETEITGKMAVIVNVARYAVGLNFVQSSQPDDGLFDVCVFQRGSAFQMLRYLYNVARRRHWELDDVKTFRASKIHVTSSEPVPAQMDGDPAGTTPCDIILTAQSLQVVVPE